MWECFCCTHMFSYVLVAVVNQSAADRITEEGLQNYIYSLRKTKTNKKRCMRIRCLQKTKVKGCCNFSPSEMEEREVLMSIILD